MRQNLWDNKKTELGHVTFGSCETKTDVNTEADS
jgi:hypothetical protein